MSCVIFKGYKNKHGYGVQRVGAKTVLAHRHSYQINKGEIPDGLVVRHKCHNPSCINPEHLELGTQKDNVYDMINAGRKVVLKGTEHPRSRLTEEQVKEIYLSTGKTQKELADIYGVSRSHIYLISKEEDYGTT